MLLYCGFHLHRIYFTILDWIAVFTSLSMYVNKKKKLKNKTSLCLYGNHITIDDKKLDFDSIHSISVLGKNKINIYTESLVYQIKGNKSFNAVKYVNIYYHYLNTQKGEKNDEQFLGL